MSEPLRAQIIRHEGTVLHAYEDSLGYLTIGVGRLIDKRRGGGISQAEADYLLDNDIARIESQLDARLSWWRTLSPVRQRALANMAFQLGVTGLLGFGNMILALRQHDYKTAADEALNSRWAQQTPVRAAQVAALIRDGRDLY